jgi:hypothetical protein
MIDETAARPRQRRSQRAQPGACIVASLQSQQTGTGSGHSDLIVLACFVAPLFPWVDDADFDNIQAPVDVFIYPFG